MEEVSHHPKLSYLEPVPKLKGQSLFLGGELGPDSKIYCIPGHSNRVLVIDPSTDECNQIGPTFEGKFKWLRGIRASNNVIYGLPCHADCVLRIEVSTTKHCETESSSKVKITTLPIPYEEFFHDDDEKKLEQDMFWKYHGGSISPVDKFIYCIPQSASYVLQINPFTDECRFVGPSLTRSKYKWYGGVVGRDGAIYATPHNSPQVLRIYPESSSASGNEVSVTLHGDFGPDLDNHAWHGSGLSSDGCIVCIPANSTYVLLINPPDPSSNETEPILTMVGGPHIVGVKGDNPGREDRKYKYLGSVSDTACNVYCLPCGAEHVLRVNTATHEVSELEPSLYESGMERLKQNKWQNGFYSSIDQCCYGIPLAAESVLKIDVTDVTDPVVTTMKLPEPINGLAKWEGGVMAKNGVMYCMPNNFKKVLRIEPEYK